MEKEVDATLRHLSRRTLFARNFNWSRSLYTGELT